jgi:glycerophosphoryl diester phosphodiesterase
MVRRMNANTSATLRRALAALAGAALLSLAPLGAAAFDLQGHRGARGLAPENTLVAFERALDIGVTTLELDIHLTSDGVPVITHDPQLNPALTRNASGQWIAEAAPLVMALPLAQLQTYDVGRLKPDTRYAQTYPEQRAADGQRIPTLAQLFERVKARSDDKVGFNIELKLTPQPGLTPEPAAIVQATLDVIRKHGMDKRVNLQSFDWRILQEVKRQAPAIPLAALTVRQRWLDNLSDGRWTAGQTLAAHGGSVPKMVKAAGAQIWSPYFGELTPDLLREAKELGLKVIPWTVNDPSAIDNMLAWGVDGLITDYPDRARKAMAARGIALGR